MKYPVPFLLFADPRGTNFPEFNTLRLRGSWAKRLKAGDLVFLAYKNDIYGSARVQFAESGRVLDILAAHAARNHLELHQAVEEGSAYDMGAAPQRRFDSMLRRYGPQKLNEQSIVSVINLKREQ